MMVMRLMRGRQTIGLQCDTDGRVAWNRIWQAFCDLAIAGGPPHKGRLLGPGSYELIGQRPDDGERHRRT